MRRRRLLDATVELSWLRRKNSVYEVPNINEGRFHLRNVLAKKPLVWCKVFSFKYKLVGSYGGTAAADIQETYYLPFGNSFSWNYVFIHCQKKPEQWKAMINCLKSGEFHANSPSHVCKRLKKLLWFKSSLSTGQLVLFLSKKFF